MLTNAYRNVYSCWRSHSRFLCEFPPSVPSVDLSFRRDSCSILHEVRRFVVWPQSPNFVLGCLAQCLRSWSRREGAEFVGIGAFLKKKEV